MIPHTLILALGNPILSDDSVGWEIADRLAPRLPENGFEIIRETGATFDLIPVIAKYRTLVVIDAIQLKLAPAGYVYRLSLDDLKSTVRRSSPHDINFATALDMGREMGYAIPSDIRIYAIEARELRKFGEGCTPELHGKLDSITDDILADLDI